MLAESFFNQKSNRSEPNMQNSFRTFAPGNIFNDPPNMRTILGPGGLVSQAPYPAFKNGVEKLFTAGSAPMTRGGADDVYSDRGRLGQHTVRLNTQMPKVTPELMQAFNDYVNPPQLQQQIPQMDAGELDRVWQQARDAKIPGLEDYEYYSNDFYRANDFLNKMRQGQPLAMQEQMQAPMQQPMLAEAGLLPQMPSMDQAPPVDNAALEQAWNELINQAQPEQAPMQAPTVPAPPYPPGPGNSYGMQQQVPMSPAEQEAQSISRFMQQMYRRQLMNSSAQADGLLNYAHDDLLRRSRRDQSDDFFGAVAAPIAGGMSGDVRGMNAFGDRYAAQAGARRGERMNIINALIGRQNRAQEYLQATDPQTIANQLKFMKAQTDANRALVNAQNYQWQHEDRKSDQGIKRNEAEWKREYQGQLIRQADERIGQALEELRMSKDMHPLLMREKKAQINRIFEDAERAWTQIEQEQAQFERKQNFEESSFFTKENNLTDRKEMDIQAENMRKRMDIDAKNEQQIRELESTNQYRAHSLDSKGKPKVNQDFINRMSVPPVVRAQLQRYNALPEGPVKMAARIAIEERYGIKLPGE